MDFLTFVYLLVIGGIVALVLGFLPHGKVELPGGLLTTIIVGYLGARLGIILFGEWPFLVLGGISILPIVLGAIVAILLAKVFVECCKR